LHQKLEKQHFWPVQIRFQSQWTGVKKLSTEFSH